MASCSGRWRYLEHDWEAVEGSYVFEPPGETHTLYVPEDVEEMITYFQVNGVMYYTDPWGKGMGFEDVFTRSTCAASTSRQSAWAPATPTSSSADPVRLAPWRRTPAAALQAPPAQPSGHASSGSVPRITTAHKTKEQGETR